MVSFIRQIPLPLEKRGQGLVEYALILVLVAIAVILVLAVIGPQVGNVFGQVITVLGGNLDDPLVSLSVARTGNEGNDVTATVTVSSGVTVTLTDSQSGQSLSLSCSGTCQGTFSAVGHAAGTVTATANGYSLSAGYPPKS